MIKRANTPVINSAPFSATQRGATLVVALFMLLLISLLAVGGMQGSIMQERMASNAHDGAMSFQASEAGLRQPPNSIRNQQADHALELGWQ